MLPSDSELNGRLNRLSELVGERSKMVTDEETEGYLQRIDRADSEFEREAKALSDLLLRPIAEKIKGKRLLIVPDARLQTFPLSALPSPLSNEPLALENQIVYQPSASTLLFLDERQKKESPDSKALLVLTDPVYSERDERIASTEKPRSEEGQFSASNDRFVGALRSFDLARPGGSLPRLPASGKEAEAISQLAGRDDATILTGAEASYQNLSRLNAANFRIIHFATHGLINLENPQLSGIVLSLYDENGNRRENGFLKLNDIYDLQLNSDLVVLSACNSGTGKEIRGEGLMSLTRAFMQAGSRSVLSSMWKVDDEATAQLMKYFYEGLLRDGLTPAEALSKAQTRMRQNPRLQSPYYWAAFNLQGEYRRPIADDWTNVFRSFWIWTVVAAANLSAAFFLTVLLRRKKLQKYFLKATKKR